MATVKTTGATHTKVDSVMDHTAVTNGTEQGHDTVRVLGLADYKGAAESIAEAFEEDEMAMYFVNTPDRDHWTREQKLDVHRKIMEYVTYAHLLKGLVVSAGEHYGCVALWMPPGHNMDDSWTILRSGMWRLNYLLTREGKTRFFDEFLPLLNVTKAQVMKERDDNSWYLVYIGTRPSARGKGYAKKTIKYVTDIADRQGLACYVESTSALNRAIYEKAGFVLKKNIHLQRTYENLDMDILVREPVAVTQNGDGK